MKKTITAILFLTATSAFAQSTLPQVRQPVELGQGTFAEGTNTRLSAEDIRVFLPWAQSSKKMLSEALLQAKRMPLRERSNFIRSEVEKVVLNSGSKRYQTLMRFALNRGLLLVNELEREADLNVQGTIENQLDILTKTINISLKFYESDLDYQKRIEAGLSAVEIDNARFGFALAKELYAANINIFDASAQYRNLYKTLEMLNWDLTQDRYARNYSEVIWDIFNKLDRMSELASKNDLQNIENVRELNQLKEKAFKSLDDIDSAERSRIARQERALKEEAARQERALKEEAARQEEIIRSENVRNASSFKVNACKNALTMDSNVLSCLESDADPNQINACGNAITMDSSTLKCIRLNRSAEQISACGDALTMDDSTLKCISSNVEVEMINTCGNLTSDSKVLSCLSIKA